jgi:hypothetical protein
VEIRPLTGGVWLAIILPCSTPTFSPGSPASRSTTPWSKCILSDEGARRREDVMTRQKETPPPRLGGGAVDSASSPRFGLSVRVVTPCYRAR